MKKLLSTIIFTTFFVSLFSGITLGVITTPVYAADTSIAKDYTLLEPLPCIEGKDSGCTKGTTIQRIETSQYINYMFRLMIALAIFLAIFMFTYGAFEYMTSEAVGSKADAKQRMWNSVLGVLAALASYLILYTIDPRLVQINAAVPAIDVSGLDEVTFDKNINNIDTLMHKADADAAKALVSAEAYRAAASTTRNQAEIINTTYGCSAGGAAASQESASQCTQYIKLLKDADLKDDQATIISFKESTKTHYYIALAPQKSSLADAFAVNNKSTPEELIKATNSVNNEIDSAIAYAKASYEEGLSKIKDQSNKQLYENTVGAEKNLEVESLQFIKANYQQLQTIASAKEAAGTVGGVVGGVVGSAVGGVVGSTIGGVIGNSAANTGASKALGNGDEIIRKFEVITKEKILKDPKNEKMYLDNQTLINTQINALAGKK